VETINKVAHLLKTKSGDVGGIVLENGMIVDTPPGHGDTLRALLKRGDKVRIEGDYRTTKGGQNHIHARKIALSPRRESPETTRNEWEQFEVAVEGEIERFAMNRNGDIKGFHLTDGTIVITPVREGENILAQLKPGDKVHVGGHRVVHSRRDSRIVANRIHRHRSEVEIED
jgi:hypothetical protein